MGYKTFEFDTMRDKYGPRKGLEGPFNFLGRVLYYDPEKASIGIHAQTSMLSKKRWTRSTGT